ncbi:hypothetical protein [Xanthomonas sp. 3307]|uniref:hypothetical protein n=1 Tax=Xanthomonas sp. 3307 TaxID=3035316 RepID=UPI0016082001|nr:hypothetical protein [Xanthomonas sp. 3307]MBB5943504.1 hypothetical protein [Xanthomonas sp. 3307]
MIKADQAKALVLHCYEASCEGRERFAIQSCTLSERGDYWIVRANSEDFVLRGIQERCYVGINAHLVNTTSGEIEIVGSGQCLDEYLQDKCDAANAGASHYVLCPDFDTSDKASVIRLRQRLECSLQRAIQLASPEFGCWLTGKRRMLSNAKEMLQNEGIAVRIRLLENPRCAVTIENYILHWTELRSALNRVKTK